jgi:hypothetical protein
MASPESPTGMPQSNRLTKTDTTMSSFTVIPEIAKVLAGLGWSDLPTGLGTYSIYRSDVDSSFFIRPIKVRGYSYYSNPTKFTVGCDYKDAIGVDNIKPHTVDIEAPKWVQSLFRWHTTATFKLVEIRAKHAERDRETKRKNSRREAHTEELKAITGDTGWLVAGGYADDGSYTSIRLNLTLINKLNERLAGQPIADAAKRGSDLLVLLKAHGFLP